mgnify:FL=1
MLAEALVKKGVEVNILTEKSVGRVDAEGLSVIPCFNSKVDFVKPVLEAVREIDPDVVHIQHDYTRYSPPERFEELLLSLIHI